MALGTKLRKRGGASSTFSVEETVVERRHFRLWRGLSGWRAARRQVLPEVAVPQDPLNHRILLDEAHDLHNSATFGALQGVNTSARLRCVEQSSTISYRVTVFRCITNERILTDQKSQSGKE